jgi:hypothetical protein
MTMKEMALEEYTRFALHSKELYENEKDVALKAVLLTFAQSIERMKEVIRKISRTEMMEESK